MATLMNQPERKRETVQATEVANFLALACELALRHKVDVATVVAVKHALELQRRNDLQIANGDAFDEQMAGFGEILNRIASSVEGLASPQ